MNDKRKKPNIENPWWILYATRQVYVNYQDLVEEILALEEIKQIFALGRENQTMKVKMIKKREEEDLEEDQEEKEEEVGAGSDQDYIGQWLDKNQIDFCSYKLHNESVIL